MTSQAGYDDVDVEPVHTDDVVTLYNADCLDVLRTLPPASVDAVVTDPPYGLEFMGKEWDAPWRSGDGFRRSRNPADVGRDDVFGRQSARAPEYVAGVGYQEWCETWARECLRVLKPGGHMLAFGGTRTAHRLASAIEDAGFDIRDGIAWLYGSGFPKSLDVSKAIDKAAGARRVVGEAKGAGSSNTASLGEYAPTYEQTAPATPEAARWQGWGTALKPSFEPIIVARKPLAGTVAANVLAHGTGALNVDGCRVDSNGERFGGGGSTNGSPFAATYELGSGFREGSAAGRWPPNVALDTDAATELDRQSGTLTSGVLAAHHARAPKEAGILGAYGSAEGERGYGDSGGASRFFPVFSPYWRGPTCCMCRGTGRDASYVTEPQADGTELVVGRAENGRACRACNGHGRDPSDMPTFRYEAKAPTDERPRVGDVAHPTVKPVDLMCWLVRLVTPPGGVVLEPFAGSGTTAEACIVEGFRCIAIEREADYIPLILSRITKPITPALFGMEAS